MDLKESALLLIENLKRANKARIVDPLIRNLEMALRKRFRQQQRAVTRAIKSAFREADASSARHEAAVAIAAYSSAQWLATYKRATQAAYKGGVGIASGQLDATEPDDLDGPERTGELAADQIDSTTRERLMNAITDGLEQAAILGAVAGVFSSAVKDRAEPAALHEVSSAFHDGMLDAAEKISSDTGDDVEKLWAIEDGDACEDCQDAFDEDWVDYDFEYPSIGGTDPGDAHPNCRCSLELRRSETA